MSIPPTITAHFTPILAPRASNCSEIWNANSLVGVKIKAKYLCGFSRSDCKIGRAKAAVFPEPVSASPITSLPWRATGIDSFWIFEGSFHWSCSQAVQRTSTRPYESKLKFEVRSEQTCFVITRSFQVMGLSSSGVCSGSMGSVSLSTDILTDGFQNKM